MAPHRPTLLLAVAAATGVAATYGALVRTRAGQELDDRLARAVHSRAPLRRGSRRALARYGEVEFAAAATALGLAGLAARGVPRTACASAALLLTVAQVEHLKHTLPRPALGASPSLEWRSNSYPSGHTAGVAGLTAMAVVLAPGHVVPLTVVGALTTGAVGVATVGARWHRPSDAVGAAMTALQWGALGLAAAEAIEARGTHRA